MKNLTLAIEEHILAGARQAALNSGTTINQLVRDYLAGLVQQADRRRAAQARLEAAMVKGLAGVGPRTWTRDELHER